MADYYKILGVSSSASDDEIKHAYRAMSRKYHPDIAGPEFEEQFKEVNTAFEVLSDPQKRHLYDSGIDPNEPGGGSYAGFDMGDVGDIFGQFFSNTFTQTARGPIPRKQPGRDSLANATVDLKTVVFGGVTNIRINTFGVCGACDGSGTQDGGAPTTCPECHGQGYRQRVVRTMFGQMMTQVPCERCEGHGTIIEHPCKECGGHGRIRTTRDVGVHIPAGIADDTRIRLAGQSEVGECGGAAGDLYIDVHVKQDEQFSRKGDDLNCWITIPMTWAVLGHDVEIDTFDGPKTLNIPADSQPDSLVSLKGLGVGKMRESGERGDLVAHILVNIPTSIDDHERKLMEKFERSQGNEDADIRQSAKPQTPEKKGFFSKLKNALL